jgi:hypothetical protein
VSLIYSKLLLLSPILGDDFIFYNLAAIVTIFLGPTIGMHWITDSCCLKTLFWILELMED